MWVRFYINTKLGLKNKSDLGHNIRISNRACNVNAVRDFFVFWGLYSDRAFNNIHLLLLCAYILP